MMQTETLLQRPTFSIGICALIEVESTLRLVGQILTSSFDDLLLKEIIVVTPDDRIASKLEGIDSRLVIVLEERREGKISALRRILKRATGDILVLASADIRAGSQSIPRLVRALAGNKDLGAVDSHVELVNGDSSLSDRIAILLWDFHNALLDQLDSEGGLGHTAGDLMAFRKDLIEKIPETTNDDAYIALTIKRKGYSVRRIQNAPAWIAGPGNPADYVAQRSRVLLGHFQLIQLFGTMPTTFEFSMLTNPLRNLVVLRRVVIRLGRRFFPALFVAILLELVSLQVAISQLTIKRRYRPWRIAASTKKV